MRHIIVGASAAGMAAAEAIRKRQATAEIVMLCDEPHPPYYRPLIPYLIHAGKQETELVREARLTPQAIELRRARAVSLNPAGHTLALADGHQLSYDRLLIATGASPIRPPIPGLEGSGVFTLRTWDDALAIAQAAKGAATAVVLGAGRIGMKASFALRHLGIAVTVVELLERLVPQQLDATSADIFTETVCQAGIQMRLGCTLQTVNRRHGHVASVTLEDGSELPADLVIVGVGVRPNLELPLSGGLNSANGLLVDEHLRTSAPDIYAAGDVVETVDILTGQPTLSGIWTNAAAMGQVAGDNMAGGSSVYAGAFSLLNAMELGGLPVISVGEIQAEPGGDVEVFAERRGANYRKLVWRGSRLVGLILVGDIERAGVYQALIRQKADTTALRNQLLGRRFHYGHYVLSQPREVDRYVR